MNGLYLLILIGIYALISAARRESDEITDATPSTPQTKDAYDV